MIELLHLALAAPLGIIIETPDDPERVRQKLYAARRESEDFSCLSICMSPVNPQQLWLVKKNA